MDTIIDPTLAPTIAYLFLASGLILGVLAILNPGTGILEIVALICLVFAGYGVATLPVNWWSLLIIFIGLVLFLLAVRKPQQIIYLIVSIAALVLGSVFLFRGETWWAPAVNPYLAAVVSIFSAGFFWIATRKILEARSARPTHDLGALIETTGEAKSDIHTEGSVQVAGELWSAKSKEPISNGARIRVVGRDGFILEVEAIQDKNT
jgi:membrane-bound serine protease (ClpP class)